jgi:ribosomal protein eL8
MAKSYVKFETPSDLQLKALEVVAAAQACGGLRKGTNETTKAIERGNAKLVVIAGDVEPEEIVMHLPMICGEHKTSYLFVSEKLALGKAAGLGVGTSSVAVLKADKAESVLKEVAEKAAGLAPKAEAKPAEAKAEKPAKK